VTAAMVATAALTAQSSVPAPERVCQVKKENRREDYQHHD